MSSVVTKMDRLGHRETVAIAVLFVALAAFPLVANWLDSPYLIRVATRILVFAIAAVSLDLILGFGGMVSFGHAAYVGVAAYVVAILSFHATNDPFTVWGISFTGTHSALIAWPAAILCSSLTALVVGAIALRTTGVYFIMITLAFAQMIYFLFMSLQQYGADEGLALAQRSDLAGLSLGNRATMYYVVLTALGLVLLVLYRLVRSKFGMVLRGCQQNERRMRAIGFKTYRYKLTAFVISGAIAGLSGVLLVNNEAFVSTADLHWLRSADLLIMVILGGAASLFGPLVGALLWVCLEFVLEGLTPHWHMILGPILILVVLYARRGVWGWLATERAGHA